MDYNLEKYEQHDSLSRDFGQWISLDNYFRNQLDEQDLKSRDYKKIILSQFSNIIARNNGKPMTTDEKGLMIMLKFKKKALIRSLYPGLLRRLAYQIRTSMADTISIKKELQMVKMAEDERLVHKPFHLPEQEQTDLQQQNTPASEKQAGNISQRYGPDLGVRKPTEQRPSGPSI